MKIPYKVKHMRINFIFGVFWLVNALLGIYMQGKLKWIDYGFLGVAALYFLIYFYQKKEKYLTFENGMVKENWPFGKQLNLNDIVQIKHFAGDLILKSENKQMTINGQLMDETDFLKLKLELQKLTVDWK
jgi:uncharacterized membrane protein YuzA (DUF378 family)